mmetsp:Transcript_1019/g.2652  ORF Transcript_1019/g.2652 Transcript_1019/m.2652 type:complete len:223 (+) Transcript_1019:103-771(+)
MGAISTTVSRSPLSARPRWGKARRAPMSLSWFPVSVISCTRLMGVAGSRSFKSTSTFEDSSGCSPASYRCARRSRIFFGPSFLVVSSWRFLGRGLATALKAAGMSVASGTPLNATTRASCLRSWWVLRGLAPCSAVHSITEWVPRATSPRQLQSRHPHIVSLRGSPTPFPSSPRVLRWSMISRSPLARLAAPWALSVITAKCLAAVELFCRGSLSAAAAVMG